MDLLSPKKRGRKKPDLSGIEPKEITIKTKTGEKTFAARSRKKEPQNFEQTPPAEPSNPWAATLNSWID